MSDHRASVAVGPEPDIELAERVFAVLRERTGDGPGVTRDSYGAGEQLAHDIVRDEALSLSLVIRTDAAGNLYMTAAGAEPGAATVIGSHLDSVPRGGNYDGAAGVLMGLSVVSGYRRAGVRPPRDLTVMAIRAEESAWFPASCIGSRAALGQLEASELYELKRQDDRRRLGAAMDAAGGDSAAIGRGKRQLEPAEIAAFIEPHIEQGPLLDMAARPVGIVTGIRGGRRFRAARCLGAYAHSGATPSGERQDAVRAVSRLVVEMDEYWQRLKEAGEDFAVTVGQFATDPDEAAFSKVAGKVAFSLDMRSRSKMTLARAGEELERVLARVAAGERVRFDLGPPSFSEPAAMHPDVVAGLADAADACGIEAPRMPCGAGHDAGVFANLGIPAGMLFVRNQHGSHNPDESMRMEDFAAAARVLSRFCAAPRRYSR